MCKRPNTEVDVCVGGTLGETVGGTTGYRSQLLLAAVCLATGFWLPMTVRLTSEIYVCINPKRYVSIQ